MPKVRWKRWSVGIMGFGTDVGPSLQHSTTCAHGTKKLQRKPLIASATLDVFEHPLEECLVDVRRGRVAHQGFVDDVLGAS